MTPRARTPYALVACSIAAALASGGTCLAQPSSAPRALMAIPAPDHDPLFIDTNSVERRGDNVSFRYVLDVRAAPDDRTPQGEWRSNEIDASIDCRRQLVSVRRLTAFPGPRASGSPTLVHAYAGADVKPQKIAANSTFAHLEAHLCRRGK